MGNRDAAVVVGAPGVGRVDVWAFTAGDPNPHGVWPMAPIGNDFGHSVCVPGDLDGDDVDDFVAGAPVAWGKPAKAAEYRAWITEQAMAHPIISGRPLGAGSGRSR